MSEKMTRERARYWIVSAFRDAMDFGRDRKIDGPVTFNPDGLATDDDVTTWADVFRAADIRRWEQGAAFHADESEATVRP